MGEKITYLISFGLFISMVSCTTFPYLSPLPSATPSGPRTIILGGEEFTENENNGFITWSCTDYVSGGRILVEVGFFTEPKLEGLGFILYDGGYSGELTYYQRAGLEHRWDWGPNENDYAFIIEANGTGLYYDFSSSADGERTGASDSFKCYQR